jgi:outer membrane protein assembly factor BamB
MRTRNRRGAAVLTGLAAILLVVAAPGAAAVPANWTGYLFGPEHGSYNAAATAVTPANVRSLTSYWQFLPDAATQPGQPGPAVYSSPTYVDGRVYVGASTGVFYALDLATRTVVWSRFLGFVTAKTCGAQGFISTATVVPDPNRGDLLTVYVAAADGNLYALDAGTGDVVWQALVATPSSTESDYFDWGSPAVRDGKVWMGISSQCDKPLVRAGVMGFDQATGTPLGTYFSVPEGERGASVWSSVAVDAADRVFATTGNGPAGTDAESIVRIDGTTMAREDGWRVPSSQNSPDDDFGGSPTLFTATRNGVQVPMVGACNKNGRYYALRQDDLSAGPVWQRAVARPNAAGQSACLAAAVWDGSRLFVAGTSTTVGGKAFAGSVRRLNPSTGRVVWARGLTKGILGTPTLNGSGVLAAGSYVTGGADVVYLINAANGKLLRTISVGPNAVWGQPVFADNYLLVPTAGPTGLFVYRI